MGLACIRRAGFYPAAAWFGNQAYELGAEHIRVTGGVGAMELAYIRRAGFYPAAAWLGNQAYELGAICQPGE
jgi:hypothetical protein